MKGLLIYMNMNLEIAKIMIENGTKAVFGNCFGNVDPYVEWVKWLSYIPSFQQVRIDELNSKKIGESSIDELDEILRYRNQDRMLKLFQIYGTNEISAEEYLEVYNFMKNESIEDLMLSKLSVKELEYAKEQIQYFSGIKKSELRDKVETERKSKNYKNLSMVDSYVLHMISNIDYKRAIAELDKIIGEKIDENDIMRCRSLYYAAGSYLS